jgi:hypothetical protein
VVHGEPAASEALARAIRDQFGLDVYVPQWREVLRLEPREGVPEILPQITRIDLRQDMQVLTADIEAEIARLKEQLASKKKEIFEDDLDKLRDIRDDLHALVTQ